MKFPHHCIYFMTFFSHLGTRLRFHRGPNVEWQEAEELRDSDDDSDDEIMPSSSSRKVATVKRHVIVFNKLLHC